MLPGGDCNRRAKPGGGPILQAGSLKAKPGSAALGRGHLGSTHLKQREGTGAPESELGDGCSRDETGRQRAGKYMALEKTMYKGQVTVFTLGSDLSDMYLACRNPSGSPLGF